MTTTTFEKQLNDLERRYGEASSKKIQAATSLAINASYNALKTGIRKSGTIGIGSQRA
tara:strand:- start:1081 stop:1254 length:174 start_codon:yes stop_codon:yes gene_type:complete